MAKADCVKQYEGRRTEAHDAKMLIHKQNALSTVSVFLEKTEELAPILGRTLC
jgi:hypothetical protein